MLTPHDIIFHNGGCPACDSLTGYQVDFTNICRVGGFLWCVGIICHECDGRWVITFDGCKRGICQSEAECLSFKHIIKIPWYYKYLNTERARKLLKRRLKKLAGK
jgi:hypothetical protein